MHLLFYSSSICCLRVESPLPFQKKLECTVADQGRLLDKLQQQVALLQSKVLAGAAACLLAGAAVTAKFESVRLSRCRGACLPVTWLLSPCRLTRCGRSFGASCMGICLRLSVCLSHVSVRFKCVQRSCVDEKTCMTAAVVVLVARVAKLSCPHGPHSCRMHECGRDVADPIYSPVCQRVPLLLFVLPRQIEHQVHQW